MTTRAGRSPVRRQTAGVRACTCHTRGRPAGATGWLWGGHSESVSVWALGGGRGWRAGRTLSLRGEVRQAAVVRREEHAGAAQRHERRSRLLVPLRARTDDSVSGWVLVAAAQGAMKRRTEQRPWLKDRLPSRPTSRLFELREPPTCICGVGIRPVVLSRVGCVSVE